MTTMNISLPDALKSFVDEQVTGRGYGTSSEYVRELIRKDQERNRCRARRQMIPTLQAYAIGLATSNQSDLQTNYRTRKSTVGY
jgi:putative addiction module CopG family antidote